MKKKPRKKKIEKQVEKLIPFYDLPVVKLARVMRMSGFLDFNY
jgi:hypothetical protein